MVPDDAAAIFNQARSISRRFAIVHIASAQFELDRGKHFLFGPCISPVHVALKLKKENTFSVIK